MTKKEWHKDVIYQIYPKSFLDTSGNGFGDILGVINKLDYFVELGVNCLWLSPVFKSPMKDNGYDISDYYAIDPIFGTNEDMYTLIQEAAKKGIKIMLDLVVNHTSDQHYWFQEALKGKDNPYRDYYIWRDQKNDLKSIFLGDAWEYDEASKEYYFHLFAKEQPDLNWENIEVRKEIYKMMNFWIDKGVSGFRMDVIEFLGKEPDNLITSDGPKLHSYIYEMNRNTFGTKDVITVGESWSATDKTARLYTDPDRDELSMIFRFDHITSFWDSKLGKWNLEPFKVEQLRNILFDRQKKSNQKYWNTLFWGNHDLPRSVSQYVKEPYHEFGAKMLFGITAFMSGTPFIYQGDEIGMTNVVLSPEDYRDVEAKNALDMLMDSGYTMDDAVKMVNVSSRDNARTPMQWSEEQHSGFTKNEPWIKINENYKTINVNKQLDEVDSVLSYYKNTIRHRRKFSDTVLYGDFIPIFEKYEDIIAYKRVGTHETIIVIANFSDQEFTLEFDVNDYEVISNNYKVVDSTLQPYQIVVFKE